jgi:hypothetical protein
VIYAAHFGRTNVRNRAPQAKTEDGRVKTNELALSMSGEGGAAVANLGQLYASTRPTPAIDPHENRTFEHLDD